MGGTDEVLAAAVAYSRVALRRRRRLLALQHAQQRRPRHRQHGAARLGDGGERHPLPGALAGPDPRLGPAAPPRRSRARPPRACAPSASAASCCSRSSARAGAWSGSRCAATVSGAALFWEILRVGAPGSLNTVLTNLTVVVLTALVGPFGATALAGYGMGARLEYLQIPLVFGLGSALVTMVGTNIGAGDRARAVARRLGRLRDGRGHHRHDRAPRRAVPARLARPLHHRPGRAGRGHALSHDRGPVLRLLRRWGSRSTSPRRARAGWSGRSSPASPGWSIAAVGGWLATRWLGGGLSGIFAAMAVALVVFGVINVAAVRLGAWRARDGRPRAGHAR